MEIGRGSIRVYPQTDPKFDEENNLEHFTYSPRSLKENLRDIDLVVESGQRINGVVSPNPFMHLHDFEFIKALVPDCLHSCCQGVFKGYIIWFTTVDQNGKKWYLGRKMKVINNRLIAAKPSYEITRTIECLILQVIGKHTPYF
jgi:hypothetical protein